MAIRLHRHSSVSRKTGTFMDPTPNCINCGRPLISRGGTLVCVDCNSELLAASEIFVESADPDGYIMIECPGATLYKDGSDIVEAGVRFLDDNDPSKGFEIIKHPIYSPTHEKKRRIKREAYGRIRRCRGCQDLTVRMRRREGPDFCVPSRKHPHRTRLRPAKYRTYV
ncbi:MAG: hypothetical protein AB1772_11265 [Candidatus Zixiibacteriota bacterium]